MSRGPSFFMFSLLLNSSRHFRAHGNTSLIHAMTSNQKATAIVFTTVLIDMIGMTIVLPALPMYVEKFSTSTFMIGMVYSVFAACAFFAGPVLGSLSDRYGRKPILVTSILGSAIGWVVFAIAPNIWIVFLSRMIGGFSAGNIAVSQGYLTDIATDEKDRTMKLGLIPTAIGLGFITGPAIGGLLTKISDVLPFWFTAGLTFINGLAAIFFIKESIAKKQPHNHIELNPFSTLWYGLTHKKYKTLIMLLLATSMSFESYHSTFILFLNKKFQFDVTSAGILLSAIGIMIAINQLVFMKHFWLKHFRHYRIQRITSFALIILFALITGVSIQFIFPIIVLLGLMEGTLTVINGSELSGVAEVHERGRIIGISHALIAISQAIAPAISGFFMQYNLGAPFMISAGWMIIVFIMLITHRSSLEHAPMDPLSRNELENI